MTAFAISESSLPDLGKGCKLLLRKTISAQFAAAVFGLLAAVVMQLGFARFLAPAGLGIFALATSIQHFGMIAQDAGFRTLLQRETTKSTGSWGTSPSQILGLAIGNSLAASALAAGLAIALLDVNFWPAILAALLGGVLKVHGGFVSAIMMGRARFTDEARWQSLGRLGQLVFALAVAYVTRSATAVLVCLAIIQAIQLLPVFHGVKFSVPNLKWNRSTLAFSFKLTLLALLIALYFRSGTFFLYAFSGDLEVVGRFSLVLRMLDAALFLIAPLAQIAFYLARSEKGLPNWNMVAVIALVWSVGGGVGIWIGLVFGGDIVAIIAGEQYRSAGFLLGWAAAAFLMAGPNYVMMQILLARGQENPVLASTFVGTLTGLTASILLIPHWLEVGAAMSILASETALFAMLALRLRFGRG